MTTTLLTKVLRLTQPGLGCLLKLFEHHDVSPNIPQAIYGYLHYLPAKPVVASDPLTPEQAEYLHVPGIGMWLLLPAPSSRDSEQILARLHGIELMDHRVLADAPWGERVLDRFKLGIEVGLDYQERHAEFYLGDLARSEDEAMHCLEKLYDRLRCLLLDYDELRAAERSQILRRALAHQGEVIKVVGVPPRWEPELPQVGKWRSTLADSLMGWKSPV